MAARLALVVWLVLFTGQTFAESRPAIDWNDAELTWHSYRDGEALLAASEPGTRGLFIVYADWCSTCKQYSALFRNRRVVAALKAAPIILMSANADQQPEINLAFNQDGSYVPRTYVLNRDGSVNNSWQPPQRYRYFLQAWSASEFIQFIQSISAQR